MKLTKVVVKRSKWLRGNPVRSVLLNESGRMCCLGFAGLKAGLSKADIWGLGAPSEVSAEAAGILQHSTMRGLCRADFNFSVNTRTCNALMKTNDKPNVPLPTRESKLRELGKKVGIRFTFVP